jgi:hypothetical protein
VSARPDGGLRGRRHPTLTVTLVLAFVAVATALQFAREAAVSAWNTIWAEDGAIFLADALNHPALSKTLTAYGGYIHVLPRVVASVVAAFPLQDAAMLFALAAFTTASLLAAFVFFASATVIESIPLRFALSALVVLLPAEGAELLGNVTNIHFYLLYGCFWAFVWQSDSTAAISSRSAVAATSALCDPLSAIYLPLAIWGAVKRRTRRGLVVPAFYTGGLAVQALAILASGTHPQRGTRFFFHDVPTLFSLRVTGSLLVGDRYIDNLWFRFGHRFSYSTVVIVAALIGLALIRLDRRRKMFVAICAGYAVFLFWFYLYSRGSAGMRPGYNAATWHLAGARYTLVPILLLATALLVFADGAVRGSGARWVQAAVVLAVAGLIAANFPLKSERSLGPRWTPELRTARSRCAHRSSAPVHILVAPGPFAFFVKSTCARIR